MMTGRTARCWLLIGLLALGTLQAPPAPAGEIALSLDEAVALVRRHTQGRVIDSRVRRDADGTVIYHILVYTRDGRVRTWHVDSATGEIR